MLKLKMTSFAAHFCCMAMAACTVQSASGSSSAKPDIVVFLTDDQSQLDTSLYGDLGLKTKNLEWLSKQGRTFSHAYVASPSCAPSRASLLTGLMPARHGMKIIADGAILAMFHASCPALLGSER